MLKDVPSLELLLKSLQQVPYLASKNIYKVSSFFLDLDPVKLQQFCSVLLKAKEQIVHCQSCYNWQEKERQCVFCSSEKRDRSLICVVETWQELLAIEKTGGYTGLYHVLGGVISPLEGIGPENLTIAMLQERVQKDAPLEIILAMNQTPEGEATSSFIAKKLKPLGCKISCLARGIPVGSHIESMDRLTVYKALSERRPF